MSVEQNMPEVDVHQGPPQVAQHGYNQSEGSDGGDGGQSAHGMGQSKSSRRRRRKRKGRGTSEAGGGDNAQASAGQSEGSESGNAEAVSQPRSFQASAAPQPQGQGQAQNGNGAPGGTKRWKKKFRDRDRNRGGDRDGASLQAAGHGGSNGHNNSYSNGHNGSQGGGQAPSFRSADTHQPGNNANGFKRKGGGSYGKQRQDQRGPRSFVGPMDHSYRVVNGNLLETPPSTIDTSHGNGGYGGRSRGGYQSDSQPIDYSVGRSIPIKDDAPTKIFFFIEDLFFLAKIQETSRKLGVKVAFVKNDKEQIAALTDGVDEDRPGLIVFDLNNANAKPLTLIPKLKAKLKKSVSIIGFLSHLQGDLKAKAVEAGCDTVMPRAAFSQNLPNLLRRYGIEEVEEPNYNQ